MGAAYLVQDLVVGIFQVDHRLGIGQTIGSLSSRPRPGSGPRIPFHGDVLARGTCSADGVDGRLVEVCYELARLVVELIIGVEDDARVGFELLGEMGPELTYEWLWVSYPVFILRVKSSGRKGDLPKDCVSR